MNYDVVTVGIAIAALFGLMVLLPALGRPGKPPPVTARPFLTGNEREFLGRLERALPECRVHAQVSMGALMRPSIPQGHDARQRSRHRSIRNTFDRKIVDFVIESRAGGRIIALVELDDRTHDAKKDHRRDRMTAAAGYRTIRWRSRQKPDREEIRRAVLGAHAGDAPLGHKAV